MGNEFEASTNVMQGDLLRELTDKIKEQREEEDGRVIELEAEPEPTPALMTPLTSEVTPEVAAEIKPMPPPRAPSLAVVGLMVTAFVAGFVGFLEVKPIVSYVRAHRAIVVPPPAPAVVVPPAPPVVVAVAAVPQALPAATPHKRHKIHKHVKRRR